ncbi:Nudix hydrolase domain-containing protein [Rubrivivax sp. A210]|nr:Nudix hydrolase domain-containing protein [Rubrivivax sp. A210]
MNVAALDWSALLRAASACDESARLPFRVDGRRVGSVARAHLPALRAWPQWLAVGADVNLIASERDAALAAMHAALREQGLIVAWRDEAFPLFDPETRMPLALMERAAARFWGTLTLGAHANGFLAGAGGRPSHLWIAQRSPHKATDPGCFDNLIGGGVAAGQSPWQALVREGFEEAGLSPDQMAVARAGRVIRLRRDIPEGLQLEDLHSWDLALPEGVAPSNQDGEVAGFTLMTVDEALALAAGGRMTVDAALVTLDFGLRHGLLAPAESEALAGRLFGCAV